MQAKPIRSFARGLALLEALNRLGSATALVLAREANVPRPTAYRLLRTLEDAGYVGRRGADDSFILRMAVRRLADGFEDTQWIVETAGPALRDLTTRIAWPCDISTLAGTRMLIRDTTHPTAPLSIDRNMIGRELPILASATGLASQPRRPTNGEFCWICWPGLRTSRTGRHRTPPTSRAFSPPRGVAATGCAKAA